MTCKNLIEEGGVFLERGAKVENGDALKTQIITTSDS